MSELKFEPDLLLDIIKDLMSNMECCNEHPLQPAAPDDWAPVDNMLERLFDYHSRIIAEYIDTQNIFLEAALDLAQHQMHPLNEAELIALGTTAAAANLVIQKML